MIMGGKTDWVPIVKALALGGAMLALLVMMSACADSEVSRDSPVAVAESACSSSVLANTPGIDGLAHAENASLANPDLVSVRGELPAGQLDQYFRNIGYDLAAVRQGTADVPRLRVDSLPNDFPDLTDAQLRKELFIAAVLPLVLQANESVAVERARARMILDCAEVTGAMSAADRAWLAVLATKYRSEDDPEQLLRRVDTVPPSLVLAQAAIESGWGTSRFVRNGNALFGERTYTVESGLAPLEGSADGTFWVRSFDSLAGSIESYVYNLNVSPAYKDLRHHRAQQRRQGIAPDGWGLAAHLTAYSERGTDYVNDVRSIISVNELRGLDDADLKVGTDELVKNVGTFHDLAGLLPRTQYH